MLAVFYIAAMSMTGVRAQWSAGVGAAIELDEQHTDAPELDTAIADDESEYLSEEPTEFDNEQEDNQDYLAEDFNEEEPQEENEGVEDLDNSDEQADLMEEDEAPSSFFMSKRRCLRKFKKYKRKAKDCKTNLFLSLIHI